MCEKLLKSSHEEWVVARHREIEAGLRFWAGRVEFWPGCCRRVEAGVIRIGGHYRASGRLRIAPTEKPLGGFFSPVWVAGYHFAGFVNGTKPALFFLQADFTNKEKSAVFFLPIWNRSFSTQSGGWIRVRQSAGW